MNKMTSIHAHSSKMLECMPRVRKDMDTLYPEPLSLLNRFNSAVTCAEYPKRASISGSKRVVPRPRRSGHRYRTQPITFDEIKEVDEEQDGNDVLGGQQPAQLRWRIIGSSAEDADRSCVSDSSTDSAQDLLLPWLRDLKDPKGRQGSF